jgi:hypothetical protein
MNMKKKKKQLSPYLRCVVVYKDISKVRVLHFAVDCDYVDSFDRLILDTFVHPIIRYTDVIFTYDNREFFNLI